MNIEKADIADIVEGCLKHDRKSQQTLYDLLSPMMMGVCMRYAADRDEAQDLLQDSFIRLFDKMSQLQDPQKVGAWAYQLTRTICLKRIIRRRRWKMESLDEVEDQPLVLDPFATEEVVRAIGKLPPMYRTVFNLCEVEEFDYNEVASMTGLSYGAVRTALCRAKKMLRDSLTDNNK